MSSSITMRKIWMAVAASVAVLSFFPAWTGATSWWMPGIAFTVFVVFLLEPLVLTWEIRKRGEELQITDGIAVLNHLFLGGPAPALPYPDCGLDPTDDLLGCKGFAPCSQGP